MTKNDLYSDEFSLYDDDERINYSPSEKARYFSTILYPESMIDNWEECLSNYLQVPFAYCIHDKDKNKDGSLRKLHVHLIIVYSNTTTCKAALSIVQKLSSPGKKCSSVIQTVNNVKNMYDYLIHDTEDAKKKHKYLYDPSERKTGNNFDIGAYEQLSQAEKDEMILELTKDVINKNITNYTDLVMFVLSNYDNEYFKVLRGSVSHFKELCRGNYQKGTKK